ncbi:MAG: 16S rRNA (adenine(1518)-N(6)/adenine(1519)-N(6))-dimethyltransferase RsmA [Patescibacteria group bacterium]|nr:ribosomal RNA small subunit methyltransferase A [Nanoarchaeota archaeon]
MRLSKRKGQCFLNDRAALERMAEYAQLSGNDTVLEIGAGDGRLTVMLAQKAGKVIAIEKDKRLAEILEKNLAEKNISNVEIIRGDALEIDFPRFNKAVSNLPYQISSPITFKLFGLIGKCGWSAAILTYQKEFAQRLFAKPCERNYSRLTVAANYYCSAEKLESVGRGKFRPQPKVDSLMVGLAPKPRVFEADEFFWGAVAKLFQHKKKIVRAALKDAKYNKETIEKVPLGLLKKRVFCCALEDLKRISDALR